MAENGKVMYCGVVEWLKHNTLWWSRHLQRVQDGELMGRVNDSTMKEVGVRGRPPVSWGNKEEEY